MALVDTVRLFVPSSGNLHGGDQDRARLINMRLRKNLRDEHVGFVKTYGYGEVGFLQHMKARHANEKIWHRDKTSHSGSTDRGTIMTYEESMEQVSKKAILERIGNCDELTKVLLVLLRCSGFLSKFKLRGELISIAATEQFPHGDHAFAVLYEYTDEAKGQSMDKGRGGIRAEDLRSLKNCIVCDPWVWKASRFGNEVDMKLHESIASAFGVVGFYGGCWTSECVVEPAKGVNDDDVFTAEFSVRRRRKGDEVSKDGFVQESGNEKSNKYNKIFRELVYAAKDRLDDLGSK